MKIGVAISTHNRYETFRTTYEKIKEKLPTGAMLVVVDDASTEPVKEATYRFPSQQGIAVTKNKCIELLYDADCTHLFLFDDDIYPIVDDWHDRYISTGINHLCMTFGKFSNGRPNGRRMVGNDGKIARWHEPCGCMLYLTRECVDRVGGMDPAFGIWGYEHVGYSMRIFNAGLTPYPFMDIVNSHEVFYSFDWDQTVTRSVPADYRSVMVAQNRRKYELERRSAEYIPLKGLQDVVLSTYITSVPDTQRGERWKADRSVLEPLIASMKGQRLIILNDCFPDSDDGETAFVRTSFRAINPYFARWYAILEHLSANIYGKVFCVDGTDVEMICNPFAHMRANTIYTGDEPCRVLNPWLQNHHKHPSYNRLWQRPIADKPLLNAGLIGGASEAVCSYLMAICKTYEQYGERLGLTDMASFNLVGYSGDYKIVHGRQVSTVFKSFDKANKTAWWRHK